MASDDDAALAAQERSLTASFAASIVPNLHKGVANGALREKYVHEFDNYQEKEILRRKLMYDVSIGRRSPKSDSEIVSSRARGGEHRKEI